MNNDEFADFILASKIMLPLPINQPPLSPQAAAIPGEAAI
jgi:hypothetical protein